MTLQEQMLAAVKEHTEGLEALMSPTELSEQCTQIAERFADQQCIKFAKWLIQPDHTYQEFDADIQKDLEIFKKENEK